MKPVNRPTGPPTYRLTGPLAQLYSRAQRKLGYSPKVDLETGVSNFIRWYKKDWYPYFTDKKRKPYRNLLMTTLFIDDSDDLTKSSNKKSPGISKGSRLLPTTGHKNSRRLLKTEDDESEKEKEKEKEIVENFERWFESLMSSLETDDLNSKKTEKGAEELEGGNRERLLASGMGEREGDVPYTDVVIFHNNKITNNLFRMRKKYSNVGVHFIDVSFDWDLRREIYKNAR